MKKLVFCLVILMSISYFGCSKPITSPQVVDIVNHAELDKILDDINETNVTTGSDTRGSDKKEYKTVLIKYATNRKATGLQKASKFYGEELDNGDKLKYGECNVSIPNTHDNGEIERPWFDLFENPNNHFMIHNVFTQNKRDYFNKLKNQLSKSDENDILIYIHGFNTTFEQSIYLTAQIAEDTNFIGIPIAFTWATSELFGLIREYARSEDYADITRHQLKDFLKKVVDISQGRKINIIAHSMGTRVLTNAIADIEEQSKILFNQIILAAPDIDAKSFKENIAPKLMKKTKKYTLYTSSTDHALFSSNLFHGFTSRLGRSPLSYKTNQYINTINASNTEYFTGHSYYAESCILIDDIGYVINNDLSTQERGLTMNIDNNFWIFSKDVQCKSK